MGLPERILHLFHWELAQLNLRQNEFFCHFYWRLCHWSVSLQQST
jgi:hypothetical protein